MIKNKALLVQFEREFARKEKIDYSKKLEIFDGMLEEAIYFKVLPLNNPLEGIEIDIKIAEAINSV